MAESNVDTAAQADRTAVPLETAEFDELLKKEFKPKSPEQKEAVEAAVKTLAEQALAQTGLISDSAVLSVRAMMAEIDKKLTEQINLILHHQEFQQLEGSWSGLNHLVSNTETDEKLKIRVMNISKKELAKTLKNYKGAAWDQSPLFKRIYEDEYGQFGGEPYGCLVGDYEFDHSPPDVELLGEMSKIAAASHAPFIAAAAPGLLEMDSWQELSDPANLSKKFQSTVHAGWRSLRESEDARFIGLTMPRFLSRQPYGPDTNPVEEFDFEEDTAGADHTRFAWSNSAYAMGVNINRAHKEFGWCTQIRGVESGGLVENLPTHTFKTDDGGVDMKCPTEIAIGDRREKELADNGLMPLLHRKNTDMGVFLGAQSLQKPQEFDDADATANANLAARLPYLFASCRFAHYLKCIVRDKIGSFKERADMEAWLNTWVKQYVEPNPATASEEDKARKPLSAAEVVVEDVEGNPGYYSSKFYLKPHYQLEGLTVSLRLVSRLPSEKS